MKKKYQVFISSTFEDLKEERKAVVTAILENDGIPVGMELFAASNKTQWEIIKKVIDNSDLYFVIIAGRYGTTTKNEQGKRISYTEMEFDYANSINKPIFAFIHKNPLKLTGEKLDLSCYKQNMLKKFTAKAQRGRMRGNWEDGLELSKIVGDAMRGIKEDALLDVVGWVRGDEIPDINRLASKEFAQLISDYLYYQIEKNKYGSMTNVQLHEQKAFSYQLAEDIKSRMKYVYLDLFSRNITITLTDDGIKVETSTKVTYINPCGEEITYSSNPMFRLDNPYGNAITSKEYDSYKIKLFIHNGDKDALKKYYTENGPRQARKNQTYVIGKKVLIQNREFENTIRMDTEYITRYNTFMQSTGLEYMCQKFRVNAALNDVRTNKDVQYYLKINLFATMGKENNVILDKMIHKDDRIEMVDDIVWAPEGSGYTLVLGHRQYD